MKALVYDRFGSIDALHIAEHPDPHPGPDSVVVKVVSASLNPVDYKIREGYLQGGIDTILPAVIGWDVAGVVVRAGFDTPEFQVGDEILAYARKDVVSGGTLAEFVEVPVRTATKKPAELSFEAAAALPLAGLTALQSVRRSQIAPGTTVLIHAAAGGVGSFASQLAVRAGARVIGTARPGNFDYLRSLGAEPVEYGPGLVDAVQALAPEGVDTILDFVGAEAMDTVPQLLRPGGVVTSVASPRARDEFGGNYVWVRPDPDGLAELAELAASGELHVEIAKAYDFEQYADAFAALESGHVRGKVVVNVNS